MSFLSPSAVLYRKIQSPQQKRCIGKCCSKSNSWVPRIPACFLYLRSGHQDTSLHGGSTPRRGFQHPSQPAQVEVILLFSGKTDQKGGWGRRLAKQCHGFRVPFGQRENQELLFITFLPNAPCIKKKMNILRTMQNESVTRLAKEQRHEKWHDRIKQMVLKQKMSSDYWSSGLFWRQGGGGRESF